MSSLLRIALGCCILLFWTQTLYQSGISLFGSAWVPPSRLRAPQTAAGSHQLTTGGTLGAGNSRKVSAQRVARAVKLPDDCLEMSVHDLALDVRELMISDAHLYFVGPDTEEYDADVQEVARIINYTYAPYRFKEASEHSFTIIEPERLYNVPPLVSIQRWPWANMEHGIVVWLDPDGQRPLTVHEKDRMRKVKYPTPKAAFGPEKPPDFLSGSYHPPSDPLEMWMESDVHVELTKYAEEHGRVKVILASIIEAILDSPPKWRGWMKQAKMRGTVEPNFESPLEKRRRLHSYGVSNRLQKLLKA